jgi:peptide/nickel transport system permease protein
MRRAPVAWLALWFGAAALALAWAGPGGGAHRLPLALSPPELLHPFGFDAFGRDLLAATLRASLLSALFAAAATALCCAAGLALGPAIALAPERARFAALRGLETFLAFPSLLLALGWAALRGPGWDTLLFSLVIGTVPSFSRLMVARTRELEAEAYVLAARALGGGRLRVFRSHLLPALLSLCGVKAPGIFAHALLAEATLSFLGVGAPIGRDTWGSLLAQGRDYLIETPHLAFSTGLPLFLTVLSLQLLAEARGNRYLR